MASKHIDPERVAVARGAVLDEAASRRLLSIVCPPSRLNMLRALRRTPLAASDLAEVVGKTRSATSQHLRVLREADVVTTERHGNVVRYRLKSGEAVQVLSEIIAAFDRLAA